MKPIVVMAFASLFLLTAGYAHAGPDGLGHGNCKSVKKVLRCTGPVGAFERSGYKLKGPAIWGVAKSKCCGCLDRRKPWEVCEQMKKDKPWKK